MRLLLSLFLGLFAVTPMVFAEETTPARAQFQEVRRAGGVTLYSDGRDYVQAVSLARGAKLMLALGSETSSGSMTLFQRQKALHWFEDWRKKEQRAFSVINAQFFNPGLGSTAPLAFSVKTKEGLKKGYADDIEYMSKKMLLLIGSRRARIVAYNDRPETLARQKEGQIIVGLHVEASKSATSAVGRNFVGVKRTGEVIFFSSPKAKQAYAADVLEASAFRKRT